MPVRKEHASSSFMWHELHIESLSKVWATRRDAVTRARVSIASYRTVRYTGIPMIQWITCVQEVTVRLFDLEQSKSWEALSKLESLTSSGVFKSLMGDVFNPVQRIIVDLCSELRTKFARPLFRLLRRHSFRRKIQKRIQTRVLTKLFSRSVAFGGLPADIVRLIVDGGWLPVPTIKKN